IKEEYEEQIHDLEEGYERLVSDNYVFDKVDVPENIKDIEAVIKDVKDSIALADIDEAQKKMDKVERKIDDCYAVMENEMAAKEFVDRHQSNLSRKMDHVLQSNRYVLLEIDRVSQNFFLNQNELARAEDFEEQLLKENEALRYHEKMLSEHQIAYSLAKSYFEKLSQKLSEMDKEQSDLVAKLSNLRNREKEAKDSVDLFEMDMRNMKRTLEKQHLPGLPKVYLDLFFAVSDRIEDVSAKLNRVKIDMDEIESLVKMCEEDIEMLENRTQEILDNANLTEYTIQYANRYRHSNPEVERAIAESLRLFQEEYEFEKSLEIMKDILNKIEPGAAKKVENGYFEDKSRKSF
ncbi:MAG TPA: septation ring formation regulator EzrA, partial [Candidatus Jeotgalibaca pullicola]|nr:septation ring formation regulator EzrA [Candidatus Jeotgalibaca pullicola]